MKKSVIGLSIIGLFTLVACTAIQTQTTLNFIGVTLNFIGAIMVCVSFGKNLGDAYQTNSKGKKIYLASFLHPHVFEWGMILIIIGFFLQAIGYFL